MKKLLSVLLCLFLTVSLLPNSVYAVGDGNIDGGAASVSA